MKGYSNKSRSRIYYNYDALPFFEGQLKKDIRQEGYTQVVFPVSEKAQPNIEWEGNNYFVSSIYILSRPVHHFSTVLRDSGELIIEHTSAKSDVKLFLCSPLQTEPTYLEWLLNMSGNDIDHMIHRNYGSLYLNELFSEATVATVTTTVETGSAGIVILRNTPVYLHTQLSPFQKLLTGDPVFAFSKPGPLLQKKVEMIQMMTSTGGVVEGFDFQNDVNSSGLKGGFGTFGNTIDQSGKSMNQAGQDYIFDFKAAPSASKAGPVVPKASEIVQCIPLYDNSDQVSTFVVPYGSAMSDEITKMFMTGTFQMFYTLLIAFVILFMTPILYKNYFAVAKRHGSSDDIEYGNKITYSTNLYFVFYSIIMIIGVLVDAAMYTHSITEMGFAMMIIIFFMCTYLFTLMLRGAGLDPNIYGHLQTKVDIMELINLYGRFMGENFNYMYSLVIPAILILLCFGISVGVYRSKTGDTTSMPFGNMIAVFFVGLLGIMSTFGTFISRSIEMSAGDAVI